MKIVVLDGATLNPGDVSWAPLAELGQLIIHDTTSPHELAERAKGADILLTNKTCLRRDDMDFFTTVRMVGVLATGYNVVDIDAFTERGIPVCNVVAYGVDDVAQHTMALLLELCRRTSEHTQSVKQGDWERSGQWCYWKHTPICLAGLTIGIIGFGSIGRRTGELSNAFGMSVLAHCRNPKNPPSYSPFAFVTLDHLLANSDIVALHCPLTPQTDKLINEKSLDRMKHGAILLNTARGQLVDEMAVAAALNCGRLKGFGTDVLSQEPPTNDNPLFMSPNTLITPHMSWATVRARQNIINLTAENIRRWKDGHPVNVINPLYSS